MRELMQTLVIDDSRSARHMISKIVRSLGWSVVEAENGLVALDCLKANPECRLALVDWNMDVMNGLEFVQAVKQAGGYDSMKIMMVTTETEMMQVVRAIEAGADEYMMKPFDQEALLEKLKILGLA
jgi:two-component system chemotaxis response regulator CheY